MSVMDMITIDVIKDFIKTNNIELLPTQHALCIPIINRIYLKMINNLKFDDIKINGELIIDGHHRYISSLLAKKEVGRVPTHLTSATKKHNWNSVKFVDEEWDTEDKIQKLNQDDARF